MIVCVDIYHYNRHLSLYTDNYGRFLRTLGLFLGVNKTYNSEKTQVF